jgi:uncharacterized protein (DUF433 family)
MVCGGKSAEVGRGHMSDDLLHRIVSDPEVMAGKPLIRGTRNPVELLVRMLAEGIPQADILREYSRLVPEDIRAALVYAAKELTDPTNPHAK